MSNPSLITHAFTTPLYVRNYGGLDGLNKTLSKTATQLASENESSDNNRAHQGGFYTDGTFFEADLPGAKEVRELFSRSVQEYIKELGVENTIQSVVLQGWIALTTTDDYQTPHVHRGATLSAVYYVECPDLPEPQGCIDFITPIDVQEMTFLRHLSQSYCRVKPQPGLLTIFPSYLRHFTHPLKTNATRLCIVCNAFVTQR
jgi:uncharacterized protein (TIGR02466 family)